MKKHSNKHKSNYELKERLDCLFKMRNLMSQYLHVFDLEEGEPIVDMLAEAIADTCDELGRRELEQ
jgi:hypothetical protein